MIILIEKAELVSAAKINVFCDTGCLPRIQEG
jgi:hypothetical protein